MWLYKQFNAIGTRKSYIYKYIYSYKLLKLISG